MGKDQKKQKIRIAITVLSVLLVLSAGTLAGMFIYNRFIEKQPASVIVPENVITPEENSKEQYNTVSNTPSQLSGSSGTVQDTLGENLPPDSTSPGSTGTDTDKAASSLSLYNRNPSDNTPFKATNMFPGDAETKYYCVKASYKDSITIRFHADIHSGYEKLSEVLKVKVKLLTTGETLYDGLMRDMPKSLNHALTSASSTTDELYYEITAYLDTSVGNEYMEKDLIADFRWWVEESGNLEPPPGTGDSSSAVILACLAIGSLFMLILLKKKSSKEEEQYEQ